MKKNILIIIGLLVAVNCLASEIEFGYSETKDTFMKNAKYTVSATRHPLEYTGMAKLQETNDGYSVVLNADADYDLNPFSVFTFGTYTTDTVLGITDRLDIGVGAGYEIYNDYTNRHKVSYAIMYRAGDWLNSYRYKYTYSSKIFDLKSVINFITPTEELQLDISSNLKFFKNFAIGLKHEYISIKTKRNYYSSMFLKINL